MMDIEKLIEGLREEIRGPGGLLEDAATALSTLQAENERLREMYQTEKSVCHAVQTELEQLKKGHCAGCSVPSVKTEQIKDLNDAPKLRAENEKLRADVVRFNDLFASYQNVLVPELRAENEKLRAELENYRRGHCSEGGCAAEKDRDAALAELEQVKAERDTAVSDLLDLMHDGVGYIDTCRFCVNTQCEERDGTELCSPQWHGWKEC